MLSMCIKVHYFQKAQTHFIFIYISHKVSLRSDQILSAIFYVTFSLKINKSRFCSITVKNTGVKYLSNLTWLLYFVLSIIWGDFYFT